MPDRALFPPMRPESNQVESPGPLVAAPVAGAAAGQADSTVAISPFVQFGVRGRALRWSIALGPRAGVLALAALTAGAFAVVVFAAAGPSVLVPRSNLSFPRWESGPLNYVFGGLPSDYLALSIGLSVVILAMSGAYLVALAAVRTVSMRAIVVFVVAVHVVLLLGPPLQLTDVFNYLGYAHLGGLHGLNPYTHVIGQEVHDPVFRFTTWHNLHSPYGPLFTILSYPLVWLSLPVAYWALKVVVVLTSLAFLALVWKCARQLGRDPRFVVLFVAANPIYLIYEVGGFHNDFFMLIPSMAAIVLLLARKDRAAGAALMLGVAVKFTAVLLLPFLLIAARPARRRLRVLAGAALTAVPFTALYMIVFGMSLPNLSDQSTLLTDFSVPNLVGLAIGIGGGTPGLLRLANVAVVVTVALVLRRQRSDWLSGAGWCTLALIASLAWLVPWYICWLLPLAALGSSVRLRRAALVMTAFLVITFVPLTGIILQNRGIDPMGSSVGQASKALQHKLAGL
jgi:alpha-1,6-mannosyltransferase